jgi:hypothetical protein
MDNDTRDARAVGDRRKTKRSERGTVVTADELVAKNHTIVERVVARIRSRLTRQPRRK